MASDLLTNPNRKHRVRNISPDKLRKAYYDWSIHLERFRLNEASNNYLTKSLELKNNDVDSLYKRSKGRCKTAETDLALEDINKAKKYVTQNNTNINLQHIDCYFDKNKFERASYEIAQNIVDCSKNLIPRYKKRQIIIKETIQNTIGLNAGPCLLNFRKYYDLLDKDSQKPKVENKNVIKNWKLYKKLGKCDATSNISLETKKLSIKEKAKKENYNNIYYETYLHKSSKDVVFLNNLLKQKELLNLNQTYNKNNENMVECIQYYSKSVATFTKMLHARQPLYAKKYCANSDERKSKAYKEKNLNYLQLQTRRKSFQDLDDLKKLRKDENLKELLEKTDTFCEYIEKKTSRIMPRKEEFHNEIFINVALAYCDQLKIPFNLNEYLNEEKLYVLFNVIYHKSNIDIKSFNKNDKDGVKEFIRYEKLKFFNKKNYDKMVYKADKAKEDFKKYKNRLTLLEKRINRTNNINEKCYVYHEMAQINYQQLKFDNVRIIIKLLIQLSKENDLHIWLILALILICKIEIKKHNTPNILYDLLIEIKYIISNKINNRKLENFINTAIEITNDHLEKSEKHYAIQKIKIDECVNNCFVGRVTGYKYNVQFH